MKRPIPVTIIAVLVFCIAVGNALVTAAALADWAVITAVNLTVPLGLIAGIYGIWALLFFALTAGLWLTFTNAHRLTIAVLPMYGLSLITLRSLAAAGTYERGRWLSTAVLILLITAVTAFILTRPSIRTYFENEEQS